MTSHYASQENPLFKKLKADPLIPIGVLTTCAMFVGAMFTLPSKDSKAVLTRQMFLRGRVVAQTVTLGAIFYSMYKKRIQQQAVRHANENA